MYKLWASQRANEERRIKAPEPTSGTLPNTDQPRVPHPEYRDDWPCLARIAPTLGLRDLLPVRFSPQGKVFWPCNALHFDFPFFLYMSVVDFWFCLFLKTDFFSSISELGYPFLLSLVSHGPRRACALWLIRWLWSCHGFVAAAPRYIVSPYSRFVGHCHDNRTKEVRPYQVYIV